MLVMAALLLPAMTGLQGARNVTIAASDVSGAIQTARSYAMANNTYTWIGFFEENASTPGTAGTGRLIVLTVASTDGTQIVIPDASASATNTLDPLRLTPVGKPVKVDNMHLKTFTDGTGTGDTFATRPAIGDATARIGDTSPPAAATFPLQYPVAGTPYTFTKMIQFDPRGESRINITSAMRQRVEIGLQPTHGSQIDTASQNLVAIQLSGIAGNVSVYR